MTNTQKISVQSYTFLRDFLKDYIYRRKSERATWSIATWARRLGLGSTTSMTMILNGQRNCGPKVEAALVDYFGFNPEETRHFKMLVEKDKVKAADPTHQLLETQISLAANSRPVVVLTSAQLDKINNWYFYALRQLARLAPIKKSEEYLKKIFRSEDSQINFSEAIDTLASQGFLEESDGQFKAADITLDTQSNISSDAIKVFHEGMGELAVKAIRRYDVKERNFQSCTLTFDPAKYDKANALIEKFIEDFETLMDSPKGTSVCQMNVQFFPLAVLDEKQH